MRRQPSRGQHESWRLIIPLGLNSSRGDRGTVRSTGAEGYTAARWIIDNETVYVLTRTNLSIQIRNLALSFYIEHSVRGGNCFVPARSKRAYRRGPHVVSDNPLLLVY